MKRRNYGYKICYRESGCTAYVRYFKTYTYKHAVRIMKDFIRYPPTERETNRKLNNPQWKVIPINRNEIKAGIWRECPF